MPVVVEHVDLSGISADKREVELDARLRASAASPFDLSRGPLCRYTLYRLAPDEHVWLINLHHVVSDVWSTGVLIRELEACYRAYRAGAIPELPALPVQYADYAVWQRERLQGELRERELDFWRDQLAGLAGPMELATDRPRATGQDNAGATLNVAIGPELVERLETLARRYDATLFMVLLAGLHAVLHRQSGHDDIVIGTPIANRTRTETEPLLGFFVNTLAIRADLSGRPSFASLLSQVRERTLGAYAHQDLPFEALVDALGVERDLERNPLFDVMLALQNAPMPAPALDGLSIEVLDVDTATAKFDLTLNLEPSAAGLSGQFEYATGLFDRETIEALFDQYLRLLAAAAAEPDLWIARLPLMSSEERTARVAEARAPEVDWSTRLGVDAAARFEVHFAAQVARTPDAIALGCADERWTYAELDRWSNRIAHRLRAEGVGAEDVVAILAHREPRYLAAILGAFKVGAAYVPFDVEAPDERLAAMLATCAPAVVLCDRLTAPRAAPLDVRSLAIDEIAHASDGALPPVDRAARLAYVMYTSGSTGVPKGAMLEHAGMLNQQLAKVELLRLGPADVVAQTAAPTFDISVWQFLTPLLVGGRVHMICGDRAWEPDALLAEIEAAGVTVLETVPTHLALVLERLAASDARPLARLRWLLPTGEALPADLCARWLAAVPHVPLVNAYGPAECSDDTALLIVDTAPTGGGTVPISGTVANLSAYVLDAQLEPVPVGTPGELCIAGVGVGRGYLRDAARTAASFVPDPWSAQPGARMYRTGDRARLRRDGAIEFLGRIDHQIKIRGQRIELGEIEAALATHPAVRSAAVVVQGVGLHRRLVAFATARAGETLDPAAVLDHVRRRLPSSMVPSALQELDALPTLSSGKIDRRALERRLVEDERRVFRAPSGRDEEAVAAVWAEVLGRALIGADDDFFALGGHSLIATRLVARLTRDLGVELSVRAVFEAPTVAGLAARVASARQASVPIPRALRPDELLARVDQMSELELDAYLHAMALQEEP
jgi:amino acid adenylation domain-containing protein